MAFRRLGSTLLVLAILLEGCGKHSSTQWRVGAILPLTGNSAQYGSSAREGIELALEDFNVHYTAHPISIIFEDSQADPRFGVTAANKLIYDDNVKFIIGAMASSVTLAIAPIAERNKVVLMSPASSAPALSNSGRYFFRTAYSDVYEGKVLARYACKQLGLRTFGVFFADNAYGTGIAKVFSATASSLGAKVLIQDSYQPSQGDFRGTLTAIKHKRPEAVALFGYNELGTILLQAKQIGLRCQYLSSVMFQDPNILKIAGNAANGVIYTFPAYDVNGQDSVTSHFVQEFKARYHHDPDIYAALSYDAASIVFKAMATDGYNPTKVEGYLHTLKNYPGVTGKTSFDKNGDVVKELGIKTVIHGEFEWLLKRYE